MVAANHSTQAPPISTNAGVVLRKPTAIAVTPNKAAIAKSDVITFIRFTQAPR
jgi:hypothetical protein